MKGHVLRKEESYSRQHGTTAMCWEKREDQEEGGRATDRKKEIAEMQL